MGKIHFKKPRNSQIFLGNFGGFRFFLIFSDEIFGGLFFSGINQLCNMFSEMRQNREREWNFRSEKIESFSFRANLLSVFIFLKLKKQKILSIGDARWKKKHNFFSKYLIFFFNFQLFSIFLWNYISWWLKSQNIKLFG